MANRHRARRPCRRPLIPDKTPPISGVISMRPIGWLKWGKIEACESAIMAREEGPVNWDGRSAISGRSSRNNGQSQPRRKARFWGPNRGRGPLFLAPFPRPRWGDAKRGEIEAPGAAIRATKEGPVNWRRAVRDSRSILDCSWGIRHRARRPSFRTLIAPRAHIFLAPFARRRWGG